MESKDGVTVMSFSAFGLSIGARESASATGIVFPGLYSAVHAAEDSGVVLVL